MSLECQRWIKLADLEAVGEALPGDERAFQSAHEASCAECAKEAAIWRAVKAPWPDVVPDAAEVERIVALAATSPTRAATVLPQAWKRAAFAAAAVACAAAGVLWLSGRLERE